MCGYKMFNCAGAEPLLSTISSFLVLFISGSYWFMSRWRSPALSKAGVRNPKLEVLVRFDFSSPFVTDWSKNVQKESTLDAEEELIETGWVTETGYKLPVLPVVLLNLL